jgi:hypothetical protein
MENWQSALCTRAKTGRPISGWPSHLGWWPNYKENRGGREGSPMTAGRQCQRRGLAGDSVEEHYGDSGFDFGDRGEE